MNGRQMIELLRAGEVLVMTGRGTREQEATLSVLYERGLIELQRRAGALLIRWRREPEYVLVRVVERTWYGARIRYVWAEVEADTW